MVSMDSELALKMRVRKLCMRYILNKQFWLDISQVISKSVRRELTFLVECSLFQRIGAITEDAEKAIDRHIL